MMRCLIVLAVALSAAAVSAAPRGALRGVSPKDSGGVVWYVTGPSNFEAANDIAWPGDAGPTSYGYTAVGPQWPGASDRGWWNTIKGLNLPGLSLYTRNNSESGYSVCNYLNPYCCAELPTWRVESCPLDDAAGDAECNAHNAGATCEKSTTYYLETTANDATPEGLTQGFATHVTFAPGPNECTRAGGTVAARVDEIIDATRSMIDAFLAFPRVRKVYLHIGISWHDRVADNYPVCKDLLDYPGVCSDCTNTFADLVAEYTDGRVVLQDGAYRAVNGRTSMSGDASLWELYTSDELHENILGWQLVTIPDMLASLGFGVTDRAPTHPVVAVDSVTSTTATISLASAVTDPDGDTLTCLVWAHPTAGGQWAGGYKPADRVHNGYNVCKQKNGGTPCANCGDASSDADCDAAGNYTDADAAYWLTPSDAPVVPDCAAEGNRCMPDFFAIPCNASAPVTMHGLAASTQYRLYSIAWPTLVPSTTARGIRPSAINDLTTFTTAAP